MHNLIMSRALLQILKSPLPDLYNLENEIGEKTIETGMRSPSAMGLGMKQNIDRKLNVNACEFVPRSSQLAESNKVDDEVDFIELKRHFESMDEVKNKTKLTLPWKGFPKTQSRQENAGASRNAHIVSFGDEEYLIVSGTRRSKKEKLTTNIEKKVETKEKSPSDGVGQAKLKELEDKRRELERKVALEALKLVEQRRMREPLVLPKNVVHSDDGPTDSNEKPIVHLSHSPVRFNPAERERVNRLRVAKRERIELVLQEMDREQQNRKMTVPGSSKRFINQPKAETKNQTVITTATAKRYIPTVKEWDEKCKLKLEKLSKENKENKQTLTQADNQISSKHYNNNNKSTETKSDSCIPRYVPPGLVMAGETRRGNLTHAGLMTPMMITNFKQYADPRDGNEKPILRYSIEQLLQLEPQPYDLEMPKISQAMIKFDILCD